MALSTLAVPPDQYEQEGAVEFEPGKRRWPCDVEVWDDFVSVEEEQMLIAKMRALGDWEGGAEKRLSVSETTLMSSSLNLLDDADWRAHLSQIHHGPHFDYSTNATKETVRPLPPYVARILAALPYAESGHPVDQMTGQLYPAGSGIPPHVRARVSSALSVDSPSSRPVRLIEVLTSYLLCLQLAPPGRHPVRISRLTFLTCWNREP